MKESETKLKDRYEALVQHGIEAKLDPKDGIVITDKTVTFAEDSEWRMMVSRLAQGKRPFRD